MNTVDWSHWMTDTDAQNAALRRRYYAAMQAMADDAKSHDRREQAQRAAASKAIADRQRAQAGRR